MHIRKLNALRALAALIVFVTHFSDITNLLDGKLGGGSGAYGVMLFFMLSGFLIAYLYINTPFSQSNLIKYALARIGRIVPLYVLVVVLSYWLTVNDHSELYYIPDLTSLIGHIGFLYGDSVLWSISPEVQFYALFIVFWALATRHRAHIYTLMATIMVLLFLFNFPKFYGEIAGIPYNEFYVIRSLPFFFIGVIFGMNYHSIVIPSYMKKHRFILALFLIPMLYPELTPVISEAKYKMWLSYEVLLVIGLVFFSVVFLVPDTNPILANKLTDFLGKISYSLYLLHMPIIYQVNKLPIHIATKLLLSLTLSIAIAYLSFRFFEKPIANRIRQAKAEN